VVEATRLHGSVAVTLARPLHASKNGLNKRHFKSDFHAYGSESSFL